MARRRLLEVSTWSRYRTLPEMIAETQEGSPLHTLLTRFLLTELMATLQLHLPRLPTTWLAAELGADAQRLREFKGGARPTARELAQLLDGCRDLEAAPVTAYMVARDALAELAPRRSIARIRRALTIETVRVHARFGSHFPDNLLDL